MNAILEKNRKILVVFAHILVWVLFMIIPYIGTDLAFNNNRFFDRFYSSLIFIAYFYLNYFILIPKLFNSRKYLLFALVTIIIAAFLIYLNQLLTKPPEFLEKIDFERLRPGKRGRKPHFLEFRFVGMFLSFFLGSMALRLFQNWNKRENDLKEAENERIKSELSYLKYQVSPHFLFNTLNSLYSLAVERSKDTPDVVLKLSELMRYLLYTNSQRLVNLRDEVKHIESYIDLQKLRLFEDVKIELSIDEKNLDQMVEPMLLIPFIENAFKYGISYSEECKILISLKVEDNFLMLETENKIFQSNGHTENEEGIGLKNVKRRLQLIYPNRHVLILNNEDNQFKVSLKINLNEDELHHS